MRKFFLLALALFYFYSCVEDVDIKNEQKPKIVVNALLNTDGLQKLSLTQSNPLGDYYYDEVEKADIILWDGEKEAGRYVKVGFSKWELDYLPLGGHKYSLEVNLPDGKVISATTTMPKSLHISKTGNKNTDYRKYFLQGPTDNPYYIFVINQQGTEIVAVPVVEPDNILELHVGTNHPYVDHFNIEQESMQSLWGGDFSTMQFIAYMRIYDEKLKDIDELSFCVEGSLAKSLVFFRSASDEYDKYLKSSFQKMLVYQAFNDDTQKFDENEVYSNINNGIGIFAAYNDQTIVFNEVEN